ncbi:succinylglutamate desuccinylase/aspartoacylase family protein [Paenibacillus sp. GCM10027626]|uniref:succinylglutamate desuccinylase/aspartoacylase family protein n=1 Tax=Paenibacillus sp. GCM10027626 TaxID=3273411 RepID=UPI00362A7EB8
MITRLAADQFQLDAFAGGVKEQLVLTYEDADGAVAELPVHLLKGSEPGPVLLILAAVHGDEYEGVQTIIELGSMLSPAHIRGTLLMVPVANRYAYRAADRLSPEDGRNLAREFPGDKEGSQTQRLAWHLGQALIDKADFLLDLHSGGTYYEVAELVGYYHNDQSDIGRRSRAAAEAFGMEVLWGHAEVAPGRTVSYAGSRGIPWLYTEAAGGRRIKREEQLRFRLGALRLMQHLQMLHEPDRWLAQHASSAAPAAPIAPVKLRYRLAGDGDFDGSVAADEAGFFIPVVELLQQVSQGEEIGSLYSEFGEVKQRYTASCDGVIVGLAGTPVIAPGSMIYTIALVHEA